MDLVLYDFVEEEAYPVLFVRECRKLKGREKGCKYI